MGYHNEHHDFAGMPWNNLPKLKRLAPEYYDSLKSYRSWTGVLLKFIFDPSMSTYSRVVRAGKRDRNASAPRARGASHRARPGLAEDDPPGPRRSELASGHMRGCRDCHRTARGHAAVAALFLNRAMRKRLDRIAPLQRPLAAWKRPCSGCSGDLRLAEPPGLRLRPRAAAARSGLISARATHPAQSQSRVSRLWRQPERRARARSLGQRRRGPRPSTRTSRRSATMTSRPLRAMSSSTNLDDYRDGKRHGLFVRRTSATGSSRRRPPPFRVSR